MIGNQIFSNFYAVIDGMVGEWPTPTSSKDVQKFLGLASYYRRFMPGFATIANPQHQLTKGTAQFKWSSQCAEAFATLKQC